MVATRTSATGRRPAPDSGAVAMPPQSLKTFIETAVPFTPELRELIAAYWEIPIELKFFGVSAKSLYFWRLNDFYVSQLPLDKAQRQVIQCRILDQTCNSLFTEVLGPRSIHAFPNASKQPFKLKEISHFEAYLLSEFSHEILQLASRKLLDPARIKGAKRANQPLVHLIWTIKCGEMNPLGYLILTMPMAMIVELPAAAHPPSGLTEAQYLHARARTFIQAGRTRLRLEELKQLERSDVLVLENSRADRLTLLNPETGERANFTANIPNKIKSRLTLPYTQEIASMLEQEKHAAASGDRLWDNLKIEVCAEFFPILLPIKELKDMSEGLVVEVGDLLQNQMRLHVDGKTIALGELVIVGDKFGVRISRIASDENTGNPPQNRQNHPEGLPAVAHAGEAENSPDMDFNDTFDEDEEDEDW